MALLSEAGESWPLTFCLNLHSEAVSLKYAKSLLSYSRNCCKRMPDSSKPSHTKCSKSLMYVGAPSVAWARDHTYARVRMQKSGINTAWWQWRQYFRGKKWLIMTVTQTAALMMHSAKPTNQHSTGKKTHSWMKLSLRCFKVPWSSLLPL